MTTLDRRNFLACTAALMGSRPAFGMPTNNAPLSPLKWAPRNRRLLSELIVSRPTSGRPYAVFDWDNTCIFGDCQETLLQFMLETFSFALTPTCFEHVIKQDVPEGELGPHFLNQDGKQIRFSHLVEDMTRDYTELWSRYGPWSSVRAPVPSHITALVALRARLLFSYRAIDAIAGPKVALYWIIRLLCGMTETDIATLAAMANRWALGRDIRYVEHIVPPERSGRSGTLRCDVFHGLRLTPEIADLQAALRQAGVDIFICSASLETVVRVFATDPGFGYGLPADHILGIQMCWPSGKLGVQPAADWPLTYGAGKVDAIRRRLVQERGHGPILVCGDSSGDTAMQTAFPDTRLSLIINRLADGTEGALSQRAANEMTSSTPRFILQGRDDNTGEWCPSEETIAFGSRTSRLLGEN